MVRNILIGMAALGIVLGAGYFLLDHFADERLRAGLEQASADLPQGASLTYERADANFLTNSGRIDGLQIEVVDEAGGIVEFDSGRIDVMGYSEDDGGLVEKAEIGEIYISFSLPDGRQVELTAKRGKLSDVALAPLDRLAQDLREGREVAQETVDALRMGEFALEGVVLAGPGVTGEAETLWLKGLRGPRIAAIGVSTLEVTIPDVSDAGRADGASEKTGDIVFGIGKFRSNGLEYMELARSIDERGVNILQDLAGPMAPETRLSDVKMETPELRIHYDTLVANYETGDGLERATGSLENFTLTAFAEGVDTFEDLEKMGYAEPTFSSRWSMIFDPAARQFRIEPFTFTLRDGGDFNLGLTVTPPEQVKSLKDLAAVEDPQGFGIDAISLEFVNAGLFQRMLEHKANEDGISVDAVKQELFAQIDQHLAEQPDIAGPIKEFVNDPQRLSLAIVLPRTLPMEMFAMALMVQPRAIAENAEVSVSAN